MNKFFGVLFLLMFLIPALSLNAQEKKKCGSGCCEAKSEKVSTSEAWNKVCPVMGSKIDPEANTAEYNGKVYGFCCNGCDSKFKKDPEKYSANLSADGTEFTGKKEKH